MDEEEVVVMAQTDSSIESDDSVQQITANEIPFVAMKTSDVTPPLSSVIVNGDEQVIASPKRKPKLIKYEPLVKGDRYRGVGYDDYCCLCGGNEFVFGPYVYYSKPRYVVTFNDLEKGVLPEALPDFVSDETDRSLNLLYCGCSVHTYCLKNARSRHSKARCPPNEHDTVMSVNNMGDYIVYVAIAVCVFGVPAAIGLVFLLDHLGVF